MGFLRIMCVVCSSCVRLCRCSLFQAPNRTFVLLFLPPLPSLIGGFGKYWVGISTDLVSVTASGGWLPLSELPWIPACAGTECPLPCSRLISRLVAHLHTTTLSNRHHPQVHLLAMSLNDLKSPFETYQSKGICSFALKFGQYLVSHIKNLTVSAIILLQNIFFKEQFLYL